jgi:hypothetical protein
VQYERGTLCKDSWQQSRSTRREACYNAALPNTNLTWTALGLNPSSSGLTLNRGKRIFFSPKRLDRPWGPPVSCSAITGINLLGVKRPGFEADNSSLSSVEVRNTWDCTSIPSSVFMAYTRMTWLLLHLHGVDFTHAQKQPISITFFLLAAVQCLKSHVSQ